MEFPPPPQDLYRPLFGDGPDPRRRPPAPPHPRKRFRVFGVRDTTRDNTGGEDPEGGNVATNSSAARAAAAPALLQQQQQEQPRLRARFREKFRALNALLLEQLGFLQDPSTANVDLEARARDIVQTRAELRCAWVQRLALCFCCVRARDTVAASCATVIDTTVAPQYAWHVYDMWRGNIVAVFFRAGNC